VHLSSPVLPPRPGARARHSDARTARQQHMPEARRAGCSRGCGARLQPALCGGARENTFRTARPKSAPWRPRDVRRGAGCPATAGMSSDGRDVKPCQRSRVRSPTARGRNPLRPRRCAAAAACTPCRGEGATRGAQRNGRRRSDHARLLHFCSKNAKPALDSPIQFHFYGESSTPGGVVQYRPSAPPPSRWRRRSRPAERVPTRPRTGRWHMDFRLGWASWQGHGALALLDLP
jgi:hypothetical protein